MSTLTTSPLEGLRSSISTTLLLGLLALPMRAQIEFVDNGGFEAGDLTGWTASGFLTNNGTLDPASPASAMAVIAGRFDAVSDRSQPGISSLRQQIFLPTTIRSATLRWSDRIQNHAVAFRDPDQEFRVYLADSNANLIQQLFSTDPNDPLLQIGPNHRLFDLAALLQAHAGSAIQLVFEQQDSLYFFNTTIDDVSLRIDTPNSGAAVGTYGTPCFNLRLATALGARPVTGSAFALMVEGIYGGSLTSLGFMLLGNRQQSIALPTGAMRCNLYTSAEVAIAFVPAGTSYRANLPIPASPSIVGVRLYAQAATFMPVLYNPPILYGWAFSNGASLTIGEY